MPTSANPLPRQYSTVIVDDDDDDRESIHYGFTENQIHDVGLFKDVQSALFYLSNEAITLPKLIISDYNMPLLTGFDFVKRLKTSKKLDAIPFVILSTYMPAKQVANCIAAGVSSYYVKPGSADEVVQLIKKIITPIFDTNPTIH